MKRILSALLLALLLLSGCAPKAQGPQSTQPMLSDPYVGVTAEEFYANYTPAVSL